MFWVNRDLASRHRRLLVYHGCQASPDAESPYRTPKKTQEHPVADGGVKKTEMGRVGATSRPCKVLQSVLDYLLISLELMEGDDHGGAHGGIHPALACASCQPDI